MISIEAFIKSAIALFIIMDPFASLPVFISLTKHQTDAQKLKSAITATAIATVVLASFVLIGPWLMEAMAISMSAFTIAGGLLLLITAITSFFGIEFSSEKQNEQHMDIKIVVVAVPLLTGPGSMTTAVILANQYGLITAFSAIALVVFAIFIVLSLSRQISAIAGERGIEISSKIFSILLAAIAVEFVKNGIFEVLSGWGMIG